jgi:hypothetical protein
MVNLPEHGKVGSGERREEKREGAVMVAGRSALRRTQ